MPDQSLALKEWNILCHAIAAGRQTFLLRKGGIAEPTGQFEIARQKFWLFPTDFHGTLEKLNAKGQAFAQENPSSLQSFGNPVPVSLLCQLSSDIYLTKYDQVALLVEQQLLSEATIKSRFDYRQPGIHLLTFRAFRAPRPEGVRLTAEIEGCRSWIDLPEFLSEEGVQPILSEGEFAAQEKMLYSLITA